MVQVNGGSRATTYVSSTQLLSTLTIADQANPGSLSVTAFTPAPGGGTSSAASIAVNNPVLGPLYLAPSIVPAGITSNTVISVFGGGFLPGTSIQVNGSARATTYVSGSQLSFSLLTTDDATVGRLAITAVNPAPNAGISPTATLTVSTPTGTPVITSVNPTSYIVGSGDASLVVYGTNFTPASVVQWNGTKLVTFYSTGFNSPNPSSYNLFAQVPAGLLATLGNAAVTVYTPTSPTATSSAVTVAITNPPVPTLTSVSPTVGPIATSTAITLNGTGFTAGSVVSFNGKPLSTTFVNATSVTATLPASANLFPSVGSFTVNTPAPGGGTSGAQNFTSYVPMVSNSMIYNPVNGLLYLSVPASAGAPYGNSIVSMDPATGALGKPISVGSEPNKLALTSDGKYLWVGLDGASGVRKVDLIAGTAGLQFALNNGSNNGSPAASALLALPGAADSVIVVQSNSGYAYAVGIYDGGILRGSLVGNSYYGQYGLQVDSARSEIYVGGNGLNTYTYDASGLTSKVTNNNSSVVLASSSLDDMQLADGKLYTDFGNVYDAEAGTLLGTFYQAGTSVAQGPTLFDTALGKVFTLDSGTGYNPNGYNQIQIFNPADYSTSATTIPINVPSYTYNTAGTYISSNPDRLVRWGSNGLAFHTAFGVFSLQSNSVKDLSGTVADLGVTATASGGTTTGSSTTYTATVVNNGPSTAKDVALAIQVPSTGVLTAATASSGSCSASTSGCSFGSVTSGSTVTATISVLQTSAGTATLNAQVSGSTTDTVSANNTGNASVTVTGSTYNLLPIVSSVAPAAIRSGSADTTITVRGLNFVSGSTVLLGSTALNTSYTSPTQLSAIVPASNLAAMGWNSVSVSSPAPGGGASNTTPLTVYSVLALGANHMVYDPFSRKIMASVSTGSSTVAGNSLVAITPETASIGTPLVLSAQPTKLALSGSGNVLYAGLLNTQSIVRYSMLAGTADTIAIPVSTNYSNTTPAAYELAVQPGTDDTLAMSINYYYGGFGIYDYTASTKMIAARSSVSNNYYNPDCLRFLDRVNLFGNSDSSNILSFTVNSTGLASTTGTNYNLNRFCCFNIVGGKAYASQGGVATLSSSGTVNQIGSFTLPASYSYGTAGNAPVAPDPSLGQVFFPGNTTLTGYGNVDGLLSYDTGTYLRNGALPLNMPTIEGNTSYNQLDLVRWGQDGLAALTSTGHLYLVRGPFVVPQLLGPNAAATLTSAAAVTHGAGNTLLTLTGSGFVPGVAVTWNGTYRTTTIVDATHVTIAVTAGDLASAGTAAVIATNPGAAASSALSVTVQ